MSRVALLISLLSLVSGSSIIPWPPKIVTMTQHLDHFTFSKSPRIFEQRIFYTDEYWDGRGPVFFYCGNEGPIESFWNNTGFVFEYGRDVKALIVFGEHRYYGESLPFGRRSFELPHIQFLSFEQAMADYAYMIDHIRKLFSVNAKVPVIAFGGSYGGMLAAYMRFKYPNLVEGALAASAPIVWVAGEGKLHQFFEVITNTYSAVNRKCPTIFRSAYQLIEQAAQHSQPGLDVITRDMRLCEPLKNRDDVDYLLRWSRNAFVVLSMVNYPYSASFMGALPANPVNESCYRALANSYPVDALREAIAVYYNVTGTKQCFNIRSEYIYCADITGCGLGDAAKSWDFQACTEMSLYDNITSTSTVMFPYIPFTKYELDEYCEKTWGLRLNADHTRLMFWGRDIESSSNIIFSNGNLDPWRLGGILRNVSDSLIALKVVGGAHHLDLRESNPADPVGVKIVRSAERELINKWIEDFRDRKSRATGRGPP